MAIKPINKIIEEVSPYYKIRAEKKEKKLIELVPETEHKLVYQSTSETLEPIYFFILDLINSFGFKTEKLVDNFTSSPGSGHYSELSQRRGIIQQQTSKVLQDIGILTKGILQTLYDLKDFQIRLEQYTHYHSKSKATSEAAFQSLKQIWMDKVDMQRGQGSINALASGQLGFQTLRDAFLAVKDENLKNEKGDLIDLNDRVKRILKSRISEFNIWIDQSERELRKRYSLQKDYLKTQHHSLMLYSRWARPYLKASAELEEKDQGRSPDLVKTFNTVILELTLLGKSAIKAQQEAIEGNLPKDFSNERFTRSLRNYNKVVLVDFNFRGIPQMVKQQGHFAFGGKIEVTFRAYALTDDELKKLEAQLKKSDLEAAMGFAEGITEGSLKSMQDEIDYFLNDKDKLPHEVEKEKNKDGSNPFMALVGGYNSGDKKKDDKEKNKKEEDFKDKEIKKDNYAEGVLREYTAEQAANQTFNFFDVYKKAHGMPSYT